MAAEFERIRAVAERLDYSPETIRLWCVQGYFPGAFRAKGNGTEWRIPAGAQPDFTGGKTKTPRRTLRRAAR